MRAHHQVGQAPRQARLAAHQAEADRAEQEPGGACPRSPRTPSRTSTMPNIQNRKQPRMPAMPWSSTWVIQRHDHEDADRQRAVRARLDAERQQAEADAASAIAASRTSERGSRIVRASRSPRAAGGRRSRVRASSARCLHGMVANRSDLAVMARAPCHDASSAPVRYWPAKRRGQLAARLRCRCAFAPRAGAGAAAPSVICVPAPGK